MIRKIKIKFIILSMTALFVLLSLIVTGMNVVNYNAVVKESDDILAVLSKNRGAFPDLDDGKKEIVPPNMSPETPYESRFFSVLMNGDGDVIQANTSRIKVVDTQMAIEYANQAFQEKKSRGFIGSYRFVRNSEENTIRITFLDCGRKINAFHTFLFASIAMASAGYAAFFVVILFFSGRIIRPIVESYEKQKRFITDAGHEIKTPLTIIHADVDVLEMEFGENEWLDDIQKQTKRLSALTNDLVYLSRIEESDDAMQMIEFPFSDVVSEAAASFQALAQTQEKSFRCDIQPMLSYVGNEKAIRQLVNILMDNALKYSPSRGTVSIQAEKQGRQIQLTVFNTTLTPVPKDQLNLIFERFYRIDSSRSTQTGGYGIGLSVAKAIVSAHKGKIRAATQDGQSLEITVQFPQ